MFSLCIPIGLFVNKSSRFSVNCAVTSGTQMIKEHENIIALEHLRLPDDTDYRFSEGVDGQRIRNLIW